MFGYLPSTWTVRVRDKVGVKGRLVVRVRVMVKVKAEVKVAVKVSPLTIHRVIGLRGRRII